jgi:dihydroorotase
MPLSDVIRATTVNAATAIRRPELGTLRPGSAGDATIFSIKKGRHEFVDSTGEIEFGAERIAVDGIVLRGRYWHGG